MKKILFLLGMALCFGACNDYLDKEPLTSVTPEKYFTNEAHLEAYANGLYTSILPSHDWSYGTFEIDKQTDNQTKQTYDSKYVKGLWKVPQEDGGNWNFTNINSCNYFFEQVLPKYEAGTIAGSEANIRHYIGEMYVLRAYEYFKRYQLFGDFPIITTPLPDQWLETTEASKRYPRNEVARFILSDLDKAADFLGDVDMATTRINKNVALLLKSRVALFEGSWLKNFNETAFVPGSKDWPGKAKEYNAGFSYQAGSIENEYQWFFAQAMEAAKTVGDQMADHLIANTGIVPQTGSVLKDIEAANPYLAMFGTEDLSAYAPEVLLWRQYSRGLGICHNATQAAQMSNNQVGVTRGLVDGFVMLNGLPIYDSASGYQGDRTIADVRKGRDPRLSVFLKEPGQKNILITNPIGGFAVPIEPKPNILNDKTPGAGDLNVTGYILRKGGSFDQKQATNGQNDTGCIIFRGVEALLNYIEASYESKGVLDETAKRYWTAIRARHAGMDTDFQKTIDHTDISKEAPGDWGAYTAGQLLTDRTLYNIRRERRCELMAEGLRWMDLCRWRSLDQLITTPYHIEGMHLYNTPMEGWYDAAQLAKLISPRERSEYIRPYEFDTKSEVYNGYTWSMAHYLTPIMIKQFLLTASDGKTIATSPLYQNPYWPTAADMPAEK